MKFLGRAARELAVFLRQCWFLVLLLGAALAAYPFEKGREFGVWLSLSYVTSFLFYVLTLYLPDRRNRKNIHRVILPYLQQIISDIKGVYYTFLAASNVHSDVTNLKDSDFHNIFKHINPQDRSTRLDYLGFGSWFEYLQHQKGRVQRMVDRILTYEHYLDTDFILAAESLNHSTLFEILDFIEKKPLQYADFGFLADAYEQCYQQADRLEAYLKKYTADV